MPQQSRFLAACSISHAKTLCSSKWLPADIKRRGSLLWKPSPGPKRQKKSKNQQRPGTLPVRPSQIPRRSIRSRIFQEQELTVRTPKSQRFEIKAPAVASHKWRQFCCTHPTSPRSPPSTPRIHTRLSKFPLFRKHVEKAIIVVAPTARCEPKLRAGPCCFPQVFIREAYKNRLLLQPTNNE